MKSLRKVKAGLCKYPKLDITRDITKFIKSIPTTNTNVYYPTKQMLEYILVRIQSFSKLLVRIVEMSMEACQFFMCKMKLGHFWNTSLLILAILSRVSSLCQHMIESCCTNYNNIFPIQFQLQLYGTPWLQLNYILPNELRMWLNLPWTLDDLKLLEQRRLELPILIVDDEDDDIQFCFEYKNDHIVIDDTIQISEDDVEFVKEYIDLINKMKPSSTRSENVIEIDADKPSISNDDKPIEVPTFNEDIGEKIERNVENSVIDLDSTVSSVITIDFPTIHKGIIDKRKRKQNTKEDSAVQLDSTTDTIVIDSPLLSSRKRKQNRLNKTDLEIQQNILNQVKRPTLPTITIGAPTNNNVLIDNTFLETLKTTQDVTRFIAKESNNRKSKNHARLTKHLTKKRWNLLVKEVQSQFENRKSLKKTKKEVVNRCKDIIKDCIVGKRTK